MIQVGTLIVRPLRANLTYSTETFGKMDPYIIVKLGTNTFTTAVAENQHKTPAWTDAFTFRVNGESTAQITVMEKDTLSKDDLIGEATLQLAPVFQPKNCEVCYEIKKNGKVTGTILVSFEFYREG